MNPWLRWTLIILLVGAGTPPAKAEQVSCGTWLQRNPDFAAWSDWRLKVHLRSAQFKHWWSGDTYQAAVPLVRLYNEAVARHLYRAEDAQHFWQKQQEKGNYWIGRDAQGLSVPTREQRQASLTQFWQTWAKNMLWPPALRQELLDFSHQNLMGLAEAEVIAAQLPAELTEIDASLLFSYLHYAYSFTPALRMEVLRDLHKIFPQTPSFASALPSSPSSSYSSLVANYRLNRFWRLQKKFAAYEQERTAFHQERGMLDAAKAKAKQDRMAYEELIYGCHSLQKNHIHHQAAQRFKLFYVGTSFMVSSIMYGAMNWDKPKDERWFGIWGYDAITGIIMRYIIAQIRANPQDLLMTKWSKNFLLSAVADIALSNAFVFFFGPTPQLPYVNNDDLIELLDQHLQDGVSPEQVTQILAGAAANQTPDLNLSAEELAQLWPQWKAYFQEAMESGRLILEDSSLDREEQMAFLANRFIEKSLSKNAFGESLAHKAWIDTGSSGLDRYIYHRLYFVALGMPSLALSIWMYHILCVGWDHPMAALTKASIIYALDKVIFDYLYFKLRRHAIHQ